jgi:hydroxyacyl-ACP dehydratase HTD2-like protein with hotdog domain
MSTPGPMAAKLQEMMDRPVSDKAAAERRSAMVRARFDWRSLKPAYVEQYRSLAAV